MKAAAERAVRENPSSPFAYVWLAYALCGSPDTAEESLAVVDQAMRLSPRDPLAWTYHDMQACAYKALGRHDQVIAASQKTLRLRPDYSWAYLALASSYAHLGRSDEAATALAEGLRLQPDLSPRTIRQALSFQDEAVVARYIADLRKAGWREGE